MAEIPISDSGLPSNRVYGSAQVSQWLEDIDLMKSHATSQGLVLSARTIDRICEVAKLRIALESATTENVAGQISTLMRKVLELHSELTLLISPATPRSLAATLHRSWDERLRRPSFIAGLLTVAICAIVVFIISTAVNERAEGMLSPEMNHVRTQLNWISAATLGATFSALFTAYRYIVNRTFDPQYTAVYWVRIILGGVAGVVLANFGKNLAGSAELTPALLALLGGYSAEAVNQLLMRVTEMLVAAVKGNGESQLREREKELTAARSKARDELSRERDRTAEELAAIVADAKQKQDTDVVIQRLNVTLSRLQSAPLA